MTTKPPSNGNNARSPISKAVTQAVQNFQAKVNFNPANFQPGKATPELRIKEANGKEQIYPLVGDAIVSNPVLLLFRMKSLLTAFIVGSVGLNLSLSFMVRALPWALQN
jgi:hypothetical protein